MIYTTSDLLDAIKRNNTLASSTFRFSDTDLLVMADEEIRSIIIPTILRLHADRLLFTAHQTLTTGTSQYDVPYRAVSSNLRELVLVDSTTSPTFKRNLVQYNYEDGFLSTQAGDVSGFYFEGDKITLVPSPSYSDTRYLKISYPIRHSLLKPSTEVATISSVDYNTGVVTCDANVPTDWTTSLYYDVIIANSRSNPRLSRLDLSCSAISGATITFTVADLPTGLTAGDRIALAGETDVLMIPIECVDYVLKSLGCKILEAQKDLQALQIAEQKLIQTRKYMEDSLTPRISGEPVIVDMSNSLIRRRRYRAIGITV